MLLRIGCRQTGKISVGGHKKTLFGHSFLWRQPCRNLEIRSHCFLCAIHPFDSPIPDILPSCTHSLISRISVGFQKSPVRDVNAATSGRLLRFFLIPRKRSELYYSIALITTTFMYTMYGFVKFYDSGLFTG